MPSADCFRDLVEEDEALREALVKVTDDPDKDKESNAVPSEFKTKGFEAMTSYIVDGKTEGLLNAAEITLPDIYPAPYVMPAEETQALKDAKPLCYPKKGDYLLYCKPSSTANSIRVSMDDCDAERGRSCSASAARPRSQSLVTYHRTADKVIVGSLTRDLTKTGIDHVAMRQPRDLGPDIIYRPSTEEMFAEYHRFISVRPHLLAKNGHITESNVHFLRFWFRYHCGWLISSKTVHNLVFTKFRLVSTGLIPCAAYRIKEAEDIDAAESNLQDAFAPSKKREKVEPSQEVHQETKFDAGKRIVLSRTSFFTATKDEEFKQNEDNTVYFDIRQDPNVKSIIRMTHRINYLDNSTPEKQPFIQGIVELTHRNTTRSKGDEYQPTHHVIDVTNQVWQTALSKIFPQANAYPETDKTKSYWEGLYASIRASSFSLVLVIFQHNEHPCTENIFTRNQDVPDLLKDIRTAVRKSPAMFTLIRGSNVGKLIDRIVQHWRSLTRYDPLNEFFVNIENPYIDNKGIKATGYPRFKAPGRFVFEDWTELARAVGIGALMEQRASMGDHVYEAKVAIVPVPGTFYQHMGLYLALHLQANVKYDGKSPRLVPGDAVEIVFDPKENTESPAAWKGSVTEATAATGMGMINITIDRPRDENKAPMDMEKRTILEERHLKEMSSMQLQEWSRKCATVPVRIFTKNGEKECKRLMDNIAGMKVTSRLRVPYEEKDKRLAEARELLLCKDHTQFEGTSLYKDVDPSQVQEALHIIDQMLMPHQLKQQQKWRDSGVYANTSWLSGPSGSGKSFLAYVSVLPYLLPIKVSNRIIAAVQDETRIAFQDETPGSVSAEDLDTGEDAFTMENGRITYCAMQNDAVDEVYRNLATTAQSFMRKMKKGPVLVLRLHSQNAELDAVKAMTRPSYNPNEVETPLNLDPRHKVTDELPLSLLSAYLAKFCGSGSPNIRDKRMKELDGSVAKYIMELARFPGFPLSCELEATFTSQELKHMETILQPIVDARCDMLAKKHDVTKELARTIKNAAAVGMETLMRKAAIVCTTTSIATEFAFNLKRRSHVVVLEEAGRASDADTFGFFSHYWSASWRLLVGATNQLPPMAFGDKKQNPFQQQITLSTITRITESGGEVAQLSRSSRFQNQQLMTLAAKVNNIPDLKPTHGYDDAATKKFSAINHKIWGIDTPLLFLNVSHDKPQHDSNYSTYNLETAAVTVRDAVNRMKYMQGKEHTIITPYKAQVRVLKQERDLAVKAARSRADTATAIELTNITITTVDSYMGQDNDSVTLDTAGAEGHLFEAGRTVVACTRAKVSFQIVGPSERFTGIGGNRRKSALTELIYDLAKAKCIRTIRASEL